MGLKMCIFLNVKCSEATKNNPDFSQGIHEYKYMFDFIWLGLKTQEAEEFCKPTEKTRDT